MCRIHNSSALLAKAPAGRHYCQFHNDADSLGDAVAQFLAAGLSRGDGVVILATPEHVAGFRQRLSAVGIDPERYQDTGQLTVADARATLWQIMRGDRPDSGEFQRTMRRMLESVRDRRRATTRVYGEMVNVLWHEWSVRGAIELEERWNELSRSHPFSLFCGYVMDGLDSKSYEGPVHEIGRTHSDILPTQEDEQLQAAVDAASEDILGLSLSLTLTFSGREQIPGEHRLPIGRRTMLWLQRNMPGSGRLILERARHYYRQANGKPLPA
jgi:hypothetical protein